jgi:rhodanese-related sulfurtransferase
MEAAVDRTLTCAALRALTADRPGVTLLDVRRRPAFEADLRLIPGAVWRDPDQVTIWAAALNQDQPILVYCLHGHEVSNGVVDRLRELGFDAALIAGGLEAWMAAGGLVTVPSGGTGS